MHCRDAVGCWRICANALEINTVSHYQAESKSIATAIPRPNKKLYNNKYNNNKNYSNINKNYKKQ